MEMNENSPIMPTELYNTIYQNLLKLVMEKLEKGLEVDFEECLDECIYSSCYWLPKHIFGCRELDCYTTMDEIVDSIRKECPNAEIENTGLNSYKIKLEETYWTLYRIVQVGCWTEETKIRISYKYYSLIGFVPTNKSPEIIKYVDSLVPEFRKLIQRAVMEGNRKIIISLIEKTASKARRKT